jgi:hypothetical protein
MGDRLGSLNGIRANIRVLVENWKWLQRAAGDISSAPRLARGTDSGERAPQPRPGGSSAIAKRVPSRERALTGGLRRARSNDDASQPRTRVQTLEGAWRQTLSASAGKVARLGASSRPISIGRQRVFRLEAKTRAHTGQCARSRGDQGRLSQLKGAEGRVCRSLDRNATSRRR